MFDILKEIEGAATIGLSGHVRPDGDAIGSCIGLALFLKRACPMARIQVFGEAFSDSLLRNIPHSELIIEKTRELKNGETETAKLHERAQSSAEVVKDRIYETDIRQFDVFIALDCGADRLGAALPLFYSAKKRINIDHHESNAEGCGEVNYVVPEASSTCELVYELIEEALKQNPALMSREIAQALYVGMVTDTGVFRYSNVTKRTMEIGGELMSYGFDFTRVCREVFFEKTYLQQQIMGRALLESIRILDDQCIFTVIEKKTMDFYQVTSIDLEGIASQLMLTEGVKAAVFLYEMEPMVFKASLRSNGEINVARIAMFFGGGGHERAAGCTMTGTWHDAINNLAQSIEMEMKRTAGE